MKTFSIYLHGNGNIENPDDLFATSFMFATDRHFTEDSIITNISLDKSVEFKFGKEFEYELQDGEVIFLRLKHFYHKLVDGEIVETFSGWSNSITIRKDYEGFKFSSTIVATPLVTVDLQFENRQTFKVTGSEFILYAGRGEHKFTSYSVTDPAGKVIWRRDKVEDLESLLTLDIPKTVLTNQPFVIVRMQYHTDTNTPSNYGKKVVVTNRAKEKIVDVKVPRLLLELTELPIEIVRINNHIETITIDIVNRDTNESVLSSPITDETFIVPDGTTVDGKEYEITITTMYLKNNVLVSDKQTFNRIAVEDDFRGCDTIGFTSPDILSDFKELDLDINYGGVLGSNTKDEFFIPTSDKLIVGKLEGTEIAVVDEIDIELNRSSVSVVNDRKLIVNDTIDDVTKTLILNPEDGASTLLSTFTNSNSSAVLISRNTMLFSRNTDYGIILTLMNIDDVVVNKEIQSDFGGGAKVVNLCNDKILLVNSLGNWMAYDIKDEIILSTGTIVGFSFENFQIFRKNNGDVYLSVLDDGDLSHFRFDINTSEFIELGVVSSGVLDYSVVIVKDKTLFMIKKENEKGYVTHR